MSGMRHLNLFLLSALACSEILASGFHQIIYEEKENIGFNIPAVDALLGGGNFSEVFLAPPMKIVKIKKAKEEVISRKRKRFTKLGKIHNVGPKSKPKDDFVLAVLKKRKQGIEAQRVDFSKEAATQREIRMRLSSGAKSELAQHIPLVGKFTVDAIEMQYAPGKPFREVTKRLSAQELLIFFIRLCRLVDAIHQEGFAHEDLAPSNILYDVNNNDFMLVDFGLAGKLGEQRKMSGQDGYSSPERSGENSVKIIQTHADIFSIGRILEEAIEISWADKGKDFISENLSDIGQGLMDSDPLKRTELPLAISKLESVLEMLADSSSDEYEGENYFSSDAQTLLPNMGVKGYSDLK